MADQFTFTTEDFTCLSQLAYELTGINLEERKKPLLYNRLVKRLRELNLADFNAYCQLLKLNNSEEQRYFIDAITTNITAFFREPHHFDYLKNDFLPQLMAAKKFSKTLRIWCAGCSTGEEPYSVAITLSEALPTIQDWDIKILASDLNLDALDIAHAGIYPQESIANIELACKKRWFLKGTGNKTGLVLVKPQIRNLITFKQFNLIGEWPKLPAFDIIFCRNVVIYFNKETQRILFDRLANALKPNGILIIGHAESLFKISQRFNLIGNTIYRKQA